MKHKTFTMMLAVLMSMTASVVCAEEHEYVDLGLPSGTLWATCNVGANSPEEYGDYFAWGETTPKDSYSWATYKYCSGTNSSITKYCTNGTYGKVDDKTQLELQDDAAYVNWGKNWRMPSVDQLDELHTQCEWIWSNRNGINGYMVKSKANDNSIFLPAAGNLADNNSEGLKEAGTYWSRTLRPEKPSYAYSLYFTSTSGGVSNDIATLRRRGCSIRPIYIPHATSISLNYETYTLTRLGKSVQLEATVLPENAVNKKVIWKSFNEAVCVVSDGLVVSTGEGTTVVSATTEDGGFVAYCTIKVELTKCAKPTISYKNGKLTFASDTEGVQFVSEITDADIKEYNEAEIDLSVTYTIRVHATHPEYYNSEEAVATLCWIEVDPQTEGIETEVKEMAALPVLIQGNNGTLHISGAEDGALVSVYTISGQLLGTTVVHGHEASVGTNLHSGIAVVKIGNCSVKVVIK